MKWVIEFAHELAKEKVNINDTCVDMTIGNGNDTLLLCKLSKFVYGFDIQNQALENTSALLKENKCDNYKLILDSHEFIDNYISEKVKLFIYNLGYLPSGDKAITTLYESTINSLNKALYLLDNKGIIIMVVYPGHEQGLIESVKVLEYVKTLPQKEYDVVKYEFINQINNPPFVIVIERKK